jgi:RHS repeat-associated protein
MTSVSGAVVWSAKYSSFGEASVEVGTVTNNLRFAGQYLDAETGLHYNYKRYYDPTTGRYLTPDPIGFEGDINFFVYVQNNPVNILDALGLDPYSNVPIPNAGDFVGVINHFLNFYNAVNLTNQTTQQINALARTIKCDEPKEAHVCFDPGPPPRDVTVGLGSAIYSKKIKCVIFEIVGTKDCCDEELSWRQG